MINVKLDVNPYQPRNCSLFLCSMCLSLRLCVIAWITGDCPSLCVMPDLQPLALSLLLAYKKPPASGTALLWVSASWCTPGCLFVMVPRCHVIAFLVISLITSWR